MKDHIRGKPCNNSVITTGHSGYSAIMNSSERQVGG